jgi:predicted nucleic acid-binding protein
MIKIFLDTNIILDIALNRDFELEASKLISTMIENNLLPGYISALSINNIHYILTKNGFRSNFPTILKWCLNHTHIISLDESIFEQSDPMIKDYEDHLQFLSAQDAGVGVIITRNK